MTLKEWLETERKGAKPVRFVLRNGAAGPKLPTRGTQEWLAARLGVDQGLVSKWVRRVTTPERYGTKIVRLSKGKVTLDELLNACDWAKALVGRRVMVVGHEASGPRTVLSLVSYGIVRLDAPVASLTHWLSIDLRVST